MTCFPHSISFHALPIEYSIVSCNQRQNLFDEIYQDPIHILGVSINIKTLYMHYAYTDYISIFMYIFIVKSFYFLGSQ